MSSEGTRRRANATAVKAAAAATAAKAADVTASDRERNSSARRQRGGVAREIAALYAHDSVADVPHSPQHYRGEHEIRGDCGQRGTLGVELDDERHAGREQHGQANKHAADQ